MDCHYPLLIVLCTVFTEDARGGRAIQMQRFPEAAGDIAGMDKVHLKPSKILPVGWVSRFYNVLFLNMPFRWLLRLWEAVTTMPQLNPSVELPKGI